MSQLVLLGAGLGAASVFALLVAALIRWPFLVLPAVAVFALINWEFPVSPAVVSVAGLTIYPEDVLVGGAVVATVLRPKILMRALVGMRPLFALLLLVLAGSLASGLIVFGPTAVNDFRNFGYAIGITAWAMNQDWTSPVWGARLRLWAKATGVGLVIVLLLHVGMYGLGTADTFVTSWATGESRTNRPLVSSQALMLACFGFIMFGQTPVTRPSDRFVGVIFLLGAIVCQHRSVWAAIAVASVLVAFHLRGVYRARLVAGGFWVMLVGLIVLLSGVAQPLVEALMHSITSFGTLAAREASWLVLVQQTVAGGPWSILFGEPLGSGYFRVIEGREIHYGPHNWYVSVFLRTGLVGLAVFVAALVATFVRAIRRRQLAAAAVVAAIAIYCWPYAISWYACVMLGWAVAVAASSDGVERHRSDAARAWRPSRNKLTVAASRSF